MSRSLTPPPPVVYGRLDALWETGFEGVAWVLYEDGKSGWDATHFLEKGDVLKVFNDAARKEQIWAGVIDFIPEPRGMTIVTLQKGTDEKTWQKMFYDEKPAILIPYPKPAA